MGIEVFKQFEDDKYHKGVLLQEYNGEFSIVAAQEGKDGAIYKLWCFPQGKDRKPVEKSLPWKVKIGGNIEEARATLEYLLAALKDGQGAMKNETDTGDDIPF